MHPRNPYRTPPDFVYLAKTYPPLQPHLLVSAAGATVDFRDQSAQRRLTEALLHRDFGIVLVVPDDRLCPPIPNRLNYILWLEDILAATRPADAIGPRTRTRVIDIGTGASAIYPLLGCRQNHLWDFVATDVDEKSLEFARLNVQQNDLHDRVSIIQSKPSGPILHHLFGSSDFSESTLGYDFTMCNPPFYSSHEDISKSAEAKEFDPNAVCTGADVEMITPGGEVAFVSKIVHESSELGTRCRWYTSMLGKLSSLNEIVTLFRELNIDNYACTEFIQGHTRRWAVAWSFDDIRLSDSIARISNPATHNLMPSRNTLKQSFPQGLSIDSIRLAITAILSTIEGLSIQTRGSASSESSPPAEILVTAARNTWSRAARRKKAHPATMQTDEAPAATYMICQIVCADHDNEDSGSTAPVTAPSGPTIRYNWVKGRDRALYESFVSHVERKITAALTTKAAAS